MRSERCGVLGKVLSTISSSARSHEAERLVSFEVDDTAILVGRRDAERRAASSPIRPIAHWRGSASPNRIRR
jgi:hypothetical protein